MDVDWGENNLGWRDRAVFNSKKKRDFFRQKKEESVKCKKHWWTKEALLNRKLIGELISTDYNSHYEME